MYSFQGKTWEQMTPDERLAHSILQGTAYAGKQGFTPNSNQGYLSQFAMGFGGGPGKAPANFWDDSDVTNPNGITSVNAGSVGFSGNPNNFSVVTPKDDFTFGGESNGGGGSSNSAGGSDQPEPQDSSWQVPSESIVASSTPFLDAYLRARERVAAAGPVSKVFKEDM